MCGGKCDDFIVHLGKKSGYFSLSPTILLRFLFLSLSLSLFFAPFPSRYDITVNMFVETGYDEIPQPSTYFPVSFQLTH